MAEWFQDWFGEEYLELYPHRDTADAQRMIALLQRELPWTPGWRVLDAACGAGRHLVTLTAAGAFPVGFDLSMALLRRAQQSTTRPLVRADLRYLPFRSRCMDLTVNLFTSFGYFATDAEHASALREMVLTVKPGGWFVIDFLNAGYVRRTLVPTERMQLGARSVDVQRRLSSDGRYVHKTMTLDSGRVFEERVRLLEAEELSGMLGQCGATVRGAWGDYEGAALGAGPRTILMAQVAA